MYKSQLDSTDIYSVKSDDQNQILLKIDSAQHQNIAFFLNAQGSDFKILHRDQLFPLHKVVVFKHMNLHVLDLSTEEGLLEVPEQYNNQILKAIISCLYGAEVKICRSQALQALQIIHFLKIYKLKKIIEDDIETNFEEYELFPLLQMVKEIGIQQIIDRCLQQLQKQNFEQMRYCKFYLLNCRQDVFKMVVHRHNERRWEDPCVGLSDKFIQELISEYSRHNNYSEKEKNQLIKEFNEMTVKSEFPSFSKITPLRFKENEQIAIKVYTPRANLKDSVSKNKNIFKSPSIYDLMEQDSSKSMIVDLTYMGAYKKRKSSRDNNSSQSQLCCDVIDIKQKNKKMKEGYDELGQTVQKMCKTMKQKESESSNMTCQLSEIESLLQQCQKSLMERTREIRLLQVRINKCGLRKLRQKSDTFQSQEQIEGSDSDSDEQDEQYKQDPNKPKSQKDEKLSVSLIQSKWVCV